jgi:hypothetical protein
MSCSSSCTCFIVIYAICFLQGIRYLISPSHGAFHRVGAQKMLSQRTA